MTSEKNKIFGILTLAFFLRITGISFGLPYLYHQDEPIIVNHALSMGAGGWHTHFFVIPPFTITLLFIAQGVYFVLGKLLGVFNTASDFALMFIRDPSSVYLIGRFLLGVCFGTATVWVLWSGARRFFGERTAFWAALLLAILPMHVQHSHYIYADIPLAFAVTLMFFALLMILDNPASRSYMYFGALAGWAASIKYTGLYFVPALLLCHVIASGKRSLKPRNLLKLFLSGACCIAIFFVIAPFTFLDWQNFWVQLSHQGEALWKPSTQFPWWSHLKYSILGGTGMLFVFLLLVGIFFMVRFSRQKAAVTGGFVLIYYLLNLYPGSQFFARYMLPLTPVLALLAAVALEGLSKYAWRGALVGFLCLELLVPTVYSDVLFLKKDTRTRSLEWFHDAVRPGTAVVVDSRFFAPSLRQSEEQIRQKADHLGGGEKDAIRKARLELMLQSSEGQKSYQVFLLTTKDQQAHSTSLFSKPFVDPNWGALKSIGAEYIVINHGDETETPRDSPAFDRDKDEMNLFIQSISDKLELVQSFSPYRDAAKKRSLDHDSTAAPHLWREIFSRRVLGPYLEVYRIKDA